MAGYKENILNKLSTYWPDFREPEPDKLVWYLNNTDGITVGRAYTEYDAKQLHKAMPETVIVEPLEIINKKALRLVRALAAWEQAELDA